MYLLILFAGVGIDSSYTALHPTMYLLIRAPLTASMASLYSLHPTMYLLIHKKRCIY